MVILWKRAISLSLMFPVRNLSYRIRTGAMVSTQAKMSKQGLIFCAHTTKNKTASCSDEKGGDN